MPHFRKAALTVPDLVLLSLLAERPMHGYQANLELERREIQDWAAISRPQVYYSLEKLATAGMVLEAGDTGLALGPERRVYKTSAKGRKALADALERDAWTTQRDRPAFLTWLALSWQAHSGVFLAQLQRRRDFVQRELEREQETLASVRAEVGHDFHEAVWMITLMIEQLQAEMRWLEKVGAEYKLRAPARHPDLVPGNAS